MIQLFTFSETSPAAASTVASSQTVLGSVGPAGQAAGQIDDFSSLIFHAFLVGATGGTLDIYIQNSLDVGVSWVDFAHFPQLAGGAAAIKYAFSASAGQQSATIQVVGINLTPALAANQTVAGPWGDRFRLVMVAGSGTSVGAAVKVNVLGQRQWPWNRG